MTPEDLEALRRVARRDQDHAMLADYLETRDQHVRELTPELNDAETAHLIGSANRERDAIVNGWDDVGNDIFSDLVTAFDEGEAEKMLEIARALFVAGYMTALEVHALLPPEPEPAEPFPRIE